MEGSRFDSLHLAGQVTAIKICGEHQTGKLYWIDIKLEMYHLISFSLSNTLTKP